MLIGVIGLGMLLGTVAGVGALFAGYSFLTALLFYASIGTFFVLVTILMMAAVSVFQGRSLGQHSYQK